MESIKQDLCEYDLLTKDIVFVDGLTRVGKAMYNRVIASLLNMSHPQFLEPLEQLLPMYKTGHIDKNAFSAFLRLNLNERAYNHALSRNLNFRYDDLTSVHNSNNYRELFKNLSKEDGNSVITELNTNKTIHQFQTHDILTHYSLFLDLDIDVQIIEVIRNPIDTIHSWYKRGWGSRFDNEDPRSFTSLFKYKGKTIPHYVLGMEDEYLKLNEMEKCVFMHNLLLKKSIKEYKQLSEKQKNNILILEYENMLNQPLEELNKICLFLNVEKTEYTEKAMLDARVPRKNKAISTDNKLDDIKGMVNIKLFNELIVLSNEYENNYNLDSK